MPARRGHRVTAAAPAPLPLPPCLRAPLYRRLSDLRIGLEEIEGACIVVPGFDGLDLTACQVPTHLFGVFDGHNGVKVASYC